MRILCVLMPHFPLACEVMRDPALAGRPAIVTRAEGSSRLVLDYSPELTGLRPDLHLQQALARHGRVELIPADMPHYRAVFSGLLDRLEDVTPLVEGAGLVIRRQRPQGKVVYVTLEDEFGHIPCMVFGKTYEKYEHEFRSPFLVIKGRLTCREGTHNVVINRVEPFNALDKVPPSKDWR